MKEDTRIDKIVYFVRHGQSEHNNAPVYQSTEAQLSGLGLSQAEMVAERAGKLSFEALLSSTLPRASQTAEAISRRTGHEIEFSDVWVERIKPSSVNGKPFTDAEATAKWRKWDASMHTAGDRVEDGENYEDIVQRGDDALDLLERRPERSLLVVTHGYFLRSILARVLLGEYLNPDAFRSIQQNATMSNTGITVLRHEDAFEEEARWRLSTYNDKAHLGD